MDSRRRDGACHRNRRRLGLRTGGVLLALLLVVGLLGEAPRHGNALARGWRWGVEAASAFAESGADVGGQTSSHADATATATTTTSGGLKGSERRIYFMATVDEVLTLVTVDVNASVVVEAVELESNIGGSWQFDAATNAYLNLVTPSFGARYVARPVLFRRALRLSPPNWMGG